MLSRRAVRRSPAALPDFRSGAGFGRIAEVLPPLDTGSGEHRVASPATGEACRRCAPLPVTSCTSEDPTIQVFEPSLLPGLRARRTPTSGLWMACV
ncbi:hypothetical protein HBB16_14220 [Pseudonocardia sp. MCCB 268]|nr:hypothetical protein [Pseudonocardia cytotoxica]